MPSLSVSGLKGSVSASSSSQSVRPSPSELVSEMATRMKIFAGRVPSE